MIYTPLSNQYMRLPALGDDSEFAILVRCLLHICEHQQWLPIPREDCYPIANVRTRDQQRAFDRVMAQHFDITDEGRKPHGRALHMLGNVPINSAARRDDSVTRSSHGHHAASVMLSCVTPAEQHRARQKRYRDDVEAMRLQAIAQGHSPRKHASKAELQALLSVTLQRDDQVTPASQGHHSRACVPADLQEIPIPNSPTANSPRARGTDSVTPTAYGEAALAMRAAGMAQLNPSRPDFRNLVDAGARDELVDAVREFPGKSFAYVLSVVERRRREAAAAAALPAKQDWIAKLAGDSFAAKLRGEQ